MRSLIKKMMKRIYDKLYMLSFIMTRIKTRLWYGLFLKECGKGCYLEKPIKITPYCVSLKNNVMIMRDCRIEGVSYYEGKRYTPNIIFMENVSIQQDLHLTCANEVIIGKNTAIAANVTITDINHPYEDISRPIERQVLEVKKVIIGEDSKIYNNAVILPGVRIGKHCVIGANSIVAGNIPDFSVAAGAPARVIRKYDPVKKKWLIVKKVIEHER
ncbi:MAG: acyltransferase [Spirochaetes bacterium]|nr:acyltransferase [Spirochaetota bacterium]